MARKSRISIPLSERAKQHFTQLAHIQGESLPKYLAKLLDALVDQKIPVLINMNTALPEAEEDLFATMDIPPERLGMQRAPPAPKNEMLGEILYTRNPTPRSEGR